MLTVAVAQCRPRKGDLAGNLDRVGALLAQAVALDPRPAVLVLPETVLSGYFLEGGVRDVALTAETLRAEVEARYRAAVPGGEAIDLVLGFYESLDGTLHNSAAYLRLQGDAPAALLHVHRKNFLPTYALFDEERFVERGYGVRAFDTPIGRAALLVCEDAWHSLTGTIAALDGAQVVFVLAAAPARGTAPRADGVPGPASVERWERLVRDIAEEQGVFCVLANLVGSEGGRMFQGGSLVVGPRGDVRARAPVFEEAMLSVTLDLADIGRVRAELPMLSDLRTMLPFLRPELDRVMGIAAAGTTAVPTPTGTTTSTPTDSNVPDAARDAARGAAPSDGATPAPCPALPVIHSGTRGRGAPPTLEIDPALVERWLVAFLRDEFRRRGFTDAVVGLSGGVDSAVVAALAARALGPDAVLAVRMPYRTSSPDSLAHAQLVIDQLRIRSRTLEITDAVDGYLAHESAADAARRGNVMARMRMITLFDLSAKHRALPLGTGNKSERLLGYFTWHADDSPPV
ncbi:MAG: NAD(+) synthase, partial [Gemmatimonadaceae bacterium]